jgi:ATP-dependent protease Clp ATPase subunit
MDEEPTCTFCGAKRSQVEKMVTNDNGAFICDKCVMQALRLMVYGQARDEGEDNE